MHFFNKIKSFIKGLELTKFDKIFFIGYISLWIYYLFSGMSYLTAGGILLILGAWLVFKGEIFVATLNYVIADIMWVLNAINIGDNEGTIFIIIGMLLGIAATYKMQIGSLAKSLKIEKNCKIKLK